MSLWSSFTARRPRDNKVSNFQDWDQETNQQDVLAPPSNFKRDVSNSNSKSLLLHSILDLSKCVIILSCKIRNSNSIIFPNRCKLLRNKVICCACTQYTLVHFNTTYSRHTTIFRTKRSHHSHMTDAQAHTTIFTVVKSALLKYLMGHTVLLLHSYFKHLNSRHITMLFKFTTSVKVLNSIIMLRISLQQNVTTVFITHNADQKYFSPNYLTKLFFHNITSLPNHLTKRKWNWVGNLKKIA